MRACILNFTRNCIQSNCARHPEALYLYMYNGKSPLRRRLLGGVLWCTHFFLLRVNAAFARTTIAATGKQIPAVRASVLITRFYTFKSNLRPRASQTHTLATINLCLNGRLRSGGSAKPEAAATNDLYQCGHPPLACIQVVFLPGSPKKVQSASAETENEMMKTSLPEYLRRSTQRQPFSCSSKVPGFLLFCAPAMIDDCLACARVFVRRCEFDIASSV